MQIESSTNVPPAGQAAIPPPAAVIRETGGPNIHPVNHGLRPFVSTEQFARPESQHTANESTAALRSGGEFGYRRLFSNGRNVADTAAKAAAYVMIGAGAVLMANGFKEEGTNTGKGRALVGGGAAMLAGGAGLYYGAATLKHRTQEREEAAARAARRLELNPLQPRIAGAGSSAWP